jgi:hypothetical protein
MSWRKLGTFFLAFVLSAPGFAGDRDADSQSLRGIPKGHRHAWAIIGGAALGAGLGLIPGRSATNFFRGALLGGSGASALYLAKHRGQGQEGPWSYVITNAALVAGIGWAVCDCGTGGGAGALVGGGGTALVQALKPRQRTLAQVTGADPAGPGNPPSPQNQPPQDQPPQAQPPQTQPPQGTASPPPSQSLPDAPPPRDQ